MLIRLKFLFYFLIASAIFLFLPKEILATISINITSSSSQAQIGEEFTVNSSMVGLEPGASYYIKCRIGKTSSEMNKGETFNESASSWLGDTDSWTSFPTILANSEGSSSVTLKCRAKSTAEIGDNLLTIRLRKVGASSNAGDSDPVTISLLEAPTPTPTPTSTPTNTPTPGPTNTPTPTSKSSTPTPTKTPTSTNITTPKLTPTPTLTSIPASTGEILGEEATLSPTMIPSPTPTLTPISQGNLRNLLPKIFIGAGILLLLGSAVPFVLPKLKKGGILKKDEEID